MGAGQHLRDPRRPPSLTAVAGLVAALLAATACSGSGASSEPPGAGPGVIFGWPIDGQWDVPLKARLLLSFSRPLPAAIDTSCARTNGAVSGTFCVEGPDGFVPGALTVDGATLAFVPAGGLAAGASYRVWARPALLPGATNLPTDTPLLTFHTRSTRRRAGEAATVLTVNGSPLAADGTSARPLYDVAPVRLVFSEPLDPATLGTAVRLVHLQSGRPVDGLAVAGGVHLTFDPVQALTAGDAYRLEIGASVRDTGGEAVAPVSLTFTPRRAGAAGKDLYPLPMIVDPAWTDGVQPPASRVGAMPANTYVMTSLLDGTATGGVLAGGLDALAGDPSAGTAMPILIRRGGRLDLSSRAILHGGVIGTGLVTGTIHFTLLTDAFGLQTRNPFRSADQTPDDAESPTFLDLTMDALVSSDDPLGNNISTQTIMGIRVLGVFRAVGGQLVSDQVAALDYQVLGLETAPISMALRMRTGGSAPAQAVAVPSLSTSSPIEGARDAAPGDPIELDFSGPVDPASLRDAQVTLTQGATSVPVALRLSGTSVVVAPSRRLDDGAAHTLHWSGLRSVAGASVPPGNLPFTPASTAATPVVPPLLLALTPGAPCALTGATAASPGHCVGGLSTDTGYQPFTLPADRDVRAYFSLPIAAASLTLGTACGQGSVRVEQVGASGECTGVVPGSLLTLDRELRFAPNAPWTAGAAYRLTLVAGPDASCDAGEICGRGGVPLNTDPLTGVAGGAGGPDVVIGFTATAASPWVYQPLVTSPFADQDASGALDPWEQANDRNRVMVEVVGYSALFNSVTLNGPDCDPARAGQQSCMYTASALPTEVHGVLEHCPVDPEGAASVMPYPCIETRTFAGIMLQTTTSMTTSSLYGVYTSTSDSGTRIVRLRELGKPILGYIFHEEGKVDAQFLLDQDTYVDAPDLVIPNTRHDLHSKAVHMVLKGPLTYRPDGRMQVALTNIAVDPMSLNITTNILPGIPASGSINLRTPAGEMRVTLAEPPKR